MSRMVISASEEVKYYAEVTDEVAWTSREEVKSYALYKRSKAMSNTGRFQVKFD